jgi:hypothetical protein
MSGLGSAEMCASPDDRLWKNMHENYFSSYITGQESMRRKINNGTNKLLNCSFKQNTGQLLFTAFRKYSLESWTALPIPCKGFFSWIFSVSPANAMILP